MPEDPLDVEHRLTKMENLEGFIVRNLEGVKAHETWIAQHEKEHAYFEGRQEGWTQAHGRDLVVGAILISFFGLCLILGQRSLVGYLSK